MKMLILKFRLLLINRQYNALIRRLASDQNRANQLEQLKTALDDRLGRQLMNTGWAAVDRGRRPA